MLVQPLPKSTPPSGGPLYSLYSFCEEVSWGVEPAVSKYTPGRHETKSALIYVNGVRQSWMDIECVHSQTSKNTKRDTYSIANVTNGLVKDFFRCVKLWLGGQSPASDKLKETLESLPEDIQDIKIVCHSEGCLITRQALHHLSNETFQKLYPKMHILSFGAPFFFDKRYAEKIENHVSIFDPISIVLNPSLIFRYIWASVNILKNKLEGIRKPFKIGNYCPTFFHAPHSNQPLKEHSIRAATYFTNYMRIVLAEGSR